MTDHERLIALAADPVTAGNRLETLLVEPIIHMTFESMAPDLQAEFVNLIALSGFLYRYLSRYPGEIQEIGRPYEGFTPALEIASIDELRRLKYRSLLRLAWMDMSGKFEYPIILSGLSRLADDVVNRTMELTLNHDALKVFERCLATFALGKLGAGELNFSSDIDLIFVCANVADSGMEVYDYQQTLQDGIRKVSSKLEQRSVDGFLYRVDLKLRPWGGSGPLVMTIDETENYYEASSEAWERFAWLRGRAITGPARLAEDMHRRLHPFVFRRSLSSDDLDRFVEIKNDMSRARRRKGYWNVKVGEGGIRDLEFFIQMLQLVNAHSHPELQVTGTLKVLAGLVSTGLVTDKEAAEITHSYLFLRRLENRLQMIDEQQTHELPEDPVRRLIISRSLGITGEADAEVLENFEMELYANRTIARNCFDRILPGDDS